MAGGKNTSPVVDPETEELWRLSRREDLADAFGVMLSIPWHGQDNLGEWQYGLLPMGGMPNMEWQRQFESDMRSLIRDTTFGLVARNLITKDQAAALDYHPYSVGPAAQEWPKIFFDLYQDARPFLADGASLLGWGYFFRDTIRGLWGWAARKEREQHNSAEASNTIYSGNTAMPTLALTRPAVLALCYLDLVERYAVSEDVVLESLPRSSTEFVTVGHPSGSESYLVRAKAGQRSFFYQVTGSGQVTEHYLIVGSTITPLPLPNFTGREDQFGDRKSLPSQAIKVEGTRS